MHWSIDYDQFYAFAILIQSERVREAVRRLLNADKDDYWILNTAFIVDDFSFVESVTVSLLDWIASHQ